MAGGGSNPPQTSDPSLGTQVIGPQVLITSPTAGPVVFDHPPMVGAGLPVGYLTFTTAAGAQVFVPCWAP